MSRSLLAAALLSAALAPIASAEESPAPGPRVLGGHQFLVSHLIEDPFSVTSFSVNLSVGGGEALGPRLDLSTLPPTVLQDSKWYGYSSIAQQVDFTARIMENLSMRAGFLAGVRQGTSSGSALVVGTNLQISGIVGLKGSFAVGDSLRLSLSAQGAYGPHFNILILQGLINAYQAGSFSASDLLQDRNATTLTATAIAAWGPAPWIGLTANLRFLRTKSADISGSTQDGVAGAGSVDFDARPLVRWLPVGADFAYRRTGSLGNGGLATQDEWSWGVYYTGRRDLVLGIEADQVRGRLDTQLKSRQTIGWVNFRYYW